MMLGDLDDVATVDALLDRAMEKLLDPDWRRRGEARDAIEIVGERASDRLIAALRSSDPALQSAAREILVETSEGRGGVHVGKILQARAALEGVVAPAPEGWLDPLAAAEGADRCTARALGKEVRRAWTRAGPLRSRSRCASLADSCNGRIGQVERPWALTRGARARRARSRRRSPSAAGSSLAQVSSSPPSPIPARRW
jgi:hypothetical protein